MMELNVVQCNIMYSREFLATDPEAPGSIPSATRFSEKYCIWNGVHSASGVEYRSYLEEIIAAPV
jgi:hypothetical protein